MGKVKKYKKYTQKKMFVFVENISNRKHQNTAAIELEEVAALQFQGRQTSQQSFWALIKRSIIYQPTNLTIPQLPPPHNAPAMRFQ